MEAFLQRLRDANLTMKLNKTSFGATYLKIPGYKVSGNNIEGHRIFEGSGEILSPDPSNVNAVQAFPTPTSVKDVQNLGWIMLFLREVYHRPCHYRQTAH